MKPLKHISFTTALAIFLGFAGRIEAASSYTFPAFNVGTLTGGGAVFTKSFNVSGVPGTEYLFVRVTANYQSAPQPHDAYSSTLNMELSDGGTNIFWPAYTATVGAVGQDSANALVWCGLFPKNSYQGGTNLTIQFQDTYNDANGPYYSTVSNVVVTLYPATTPAETFATFDVGTLTGGGAAFTKSLNVSGLPKTEFLFLRVTANYQSAPQPHDGYSSTMNMELSDGGTNIFWPTNPATVGAVGQDSTNTLVWCGLFPQNSYPGGAQPDHPVSGHLQRRERPLLFHRQQRRRHPLSGRECGGGAAATGHRSFLHQRGVGMDKHGNGVHLAIHNEPFSAGDLEHGFAGTGRRQWALYRNQCPGEFAKIFYRLSQ